MCVPRASDIIYSIFTPARRRVAGLAGQTAIAGVGGSYALPLLVVLSSQFSHIFLPRPRSVAFFQFELVYRLVERLNEDQERIDLKNSEQHQRLEQSTQALHLVANIDTKRQLYGSSVKANLC
jgi:hypothetical protein